MRFVSLLLLFLTGPLVSQIPNYVSTTGLLAWYPFSGNANDASPGLHNGTVIGPVLTTDRFNTPNSAYSYDGINDYISVPDNSLNFRPQEFSISAWVRFNALPINNGMIIAKNVNGNTFVESIDVNYAGQWGGWFCNIGNPTSGNGPYMITPFAITTGTWYHIVYQFDDSNNKQMIYVNGVFTSSMAVNSSVGYDGNLWTIGSEFENGSLSYFLNGKIDDIGIWDRIITPCEITQLYQASAISFPTTVLQPSVSLCAGSAATLQASGAVNYSWSPGQLTGSMVVVTPTANTIFTVVGSNSLGCPGTPATATIVINPKPVLAVSGNTSVCAGYAASLSVSGGSSYTWNPGGFTTQSIQVQPTVNTTYTLIGLSQQGCYATTTLNIVVSTTPAVSIASSVGTLCSGQTCTLVGSGAGSYTWMPGNGMSPSIVVTPSTTTSYSLVGSNGVGCQSAPAVITLSVNQTPQVVAYSSHSQICVGGSVNLWASGASSYTWFPGSLVNSIIGESPLATTVYTVVGTGTNGCTNSQMVSVLVNQLTALQITSTSPTVCAGVQITLTAVGASAYSWVNTGAATSWIVDTPLNDITYSVTGTDLDGCTGTAVFHQVVSRCTDISENEFDGFFRIYPNPFTKDLYVRYNKPANMTIINSIGQLIRSHKTEEETGVFHIDAASLVPGVYVLIWEESDRKSVTKIIKSSEK